MDRVFLVGACRTPIGKIGGVLSKISAVDLGATVIAEVLNRSGIQKEEVDHVILGCVLQAGLGQNVARQAALKAGLPFTTTAETVNMVCGSGLNSVNSAARLISLGEASVVIAGGTESMSNAPFAYMHARYGKKIGYPSSPCDFVDTMVMDGLWDAFNNYHMGITAENIAEKWKLTRQELDEFSVSSQQKAFAASQTGTFDEEIVQIKTMNVDQPICLDESIRPNTTIESLSKLGPVFKPDGVVTAGNSSGLNDGAAALVLVGEKKLKELGLEPMAEWCGSALAGVDPAYMGIAPVSATNKLLQKLNISLSQIDLIEINEAFASQSLADIYELNLNRDIVNVNGGAIALGHPIGASGSRILVTLLYEMKRRKASYGLATLCIGGGLGCSTVIKSI